MSLRKDLVIFCFGGMNMLTIDDLLNVVKEYNKEEVYYVKKTYDFASYLHDGQIRQSGEHI